MPSASEVEGKLAGFGLIERVRALYGKALIWFPALTDLAGTVAADYSGNGSLGTYSGDVTLAAAKGPDGRPCPLFGGTNGKVVPSAGALTALNTAGVFSATEGTFGVWFQFASKTIWDNATQYVFGEVGVDVNNRFLLYKVGANQFGMVYAIGGVNSSRGATGQTSVAPMLALVTWSLTNNKIRAYLAGVQASTDAAYGGTWAGALNATWTQIGALASSLYMAGNLSCPFLTNCFTTPDQAAGLSRMSR